MWFPKFCNLLSGALCVACLAGSRMAAEEFRPGGHTNQPDLRILIRSEELIDATNAKPLQRAFFSAGTNRFAFIVPEGFKLDASFPNKIILTSPDYTCFISVQLIDPTVNEAACLVAMASRNQAMEEFPGSTISNEFELRAANHGGPAYELNWKSSNGSTQRACVGFVPSRAGVLKFNLLSNLEKYPQSQMHFRCLLRSFQSNEGGSLEILPVSGAS